MPDTQLYRPVPAIPVALPVHEPTPVEVRVEEVERVRATVASLRNERLIAQLPRSDRYSERADERREAVALTAALHGHGTRRSRNSKRRSSSDGTIGMRFVFFEPPTAR
jgi:hypothetical protein